MQARRSEASGAQVAQSAAAQAAAQAQVGQREQEEDDASDVARSLHRTFFFTILSQSSTTESEGEKRRSPAAKKPSPKPVQKVTVSKCRGGTHACSDLALVVRLAREHSCGDARGETRAHFGPARDTVGAEVSSIAISYRTPTVSSSISTVTVSHWQSDVRPPDRR